MVNIDELLGKYKPYLEKEDYNSHFKQVAGSLLSEVQIWESGKNAEKNKYKLERSVRYFKEYKRLLDDFSEFNTSELAKMKGNKHTSNVETYIETKYKELRKHNLVIR